MGAWGSTSRNARLALPAPQNGRIRTLAKKNKPKCRSLGCGLQFMAVLKMACSQSGCTVQPFFFQRRPYEQFEVLIVLWSKDAMHVILFGTKLPGTQHLRAALRPQVPHSSGPWTPGAPAEVLASRGVVVVESWQAALQELSLYSRKGAPHTAPTSEAPSP
jgi:hypothetical protein